MESNFEDIMYGLMVIIVCRNFTNNDNAMFTKVLLGVITGLAIIIILLSVVDSIVNMKRNKILNEIAVEGAKDYYKENYGEDLEIHHVNLGRYSGEIYLDEDETKYITVYIDADYKVYGIWDTLQDDEVNIALKELIDNSLEKFDAKVSIEIRKSLATGNKVLYKGDIVDYLIKNHLRINIDIVKRFKDGPKIEEDYDKFLSEIENTLKELNLDKYYLDAMFFNEKLPERMEASDLEQSNFGIFVLIDELDLPYKEVEGEKYMYTYIKE